MTLAPAAANPSARARPMPRLVPVTMAVRPASSVAADGPSVNQRDLLDRPARQHLDSVLADDHHLLDAYPLAPVAILGLDRDRHPFLQHRRVLEGYAPPDHGNLVEREADPVTPVVGRHLPGFGCAVVVPVFGPGVREVLCRFGGRGPWLDRVEHGGQAVHRASVGVMGGRPDRTTAKGPVIAGPIPVVTDVVEVGIDNVARPDDP